MRTIQIRLLSLAALAVVTFTGSAAAEGKSTAVLNTLEVRQLVERAEPGDHARLGVHFGALAERHMAEAERHTSMSQSFAGNPSRNLSTSMSVHCKQLAQLNTQSATTLRELAAHHQKLATGAASAAPSGASRFEGGAGAPRPSQQQLNTLAAKASTTADHRGLEEYFLTLAKRYTADANEHVTLAQTYRGTRIAQAAVHHDRLASLAKDAAKEATDAATMQEDLAGVGR